MKQDETFRNYLQQLKAKAKITLNKNELAKYRVKSIPFLFIHPGNSTDVEPGSESAVTWNSLRQYW